MMIANSETRQTWSWMVSDCILLCSVSPLSTLEPWETHCYPTTQYRTTKDSKDQFPDGEVEWGSADFDVVSYSGGIATVLNLH